METDVSYTKTSLYGAIFKRKSFHLFRGVGDDRIERSELDAIADAWQGFERLLPEIRTAVRIVPASEVNFKRELFPDAGGEEEFTRVAVYKLPK